MDPTTQFFEQANSFVGRHRWGLAAGAVGLGAAAFGMKRGADDSVGEDMSERGARMLNYGLGLGIAGGTAVLGARMIGPSARVLAKDTASHVGGYLQKAWRESTGVSGAAKKDIAKAMFSRAPIAAGVGMLGGATIGMAIDKDHPERGGAIGAGVGMMAGLGVRSYIRGNKIWSNMGKVPGLQGAALIAASVGVAAGTKVMAGVEPEAVTYASNDGAFDQGYSAEPTLHDRMKTINAQGSLVFGLHNKR